MLLGVLDIGSNAAQLQVFEVRPGAPPLPTHAVKEPTLLGEAFDSSGAIDPAGVDRVVDAVNRAMCAARRLGVEQLFVFTTSAVRDAANRELILDRVEAEAGIRPQFLTGVDEGRLTRALLPDDPPSREQFAALRRHVGATLREAAGRLLWEGVPDQVVGTSRIFQQLARLSGSPAQREGIVLHYLQTMHNESFDLPLRPLNGAAYQEDTLGRAG
ncbi:MAG TPA: hypothetical protein VMC83_34695 [Streptosporangiaceae bacterium]|nr:hypothetical protein [Streptosporangiaceae bacterium]